ASPRMPSVAWNPPMAYSRSAATVRHVPLQDVPLQDVPPQGPLAKSSRFPAPEKWLDRRDGCTPALVTPRNDMLLYLLCRWFHHRWRTQCVGKSTTNSSLSRRRRRTLGSSKNNARASSMGS